MAMSKLTDSQKATIHQAVESLHAKLARIRAQVGPHADGALWQAYDPAKIDEEAAAAAYLARYGASPVIVWQHGPVILAGPLPAAAR